MLKLSVVVIIYQVGAYLRQCIESIRSQTYADFELILVDDGSTDGCASICDEFARLDRRIRVIHQRNQGSVMARWNGFLAARGEYVTAIDGDDWIEPDMFEHMLRLGESENADMVIVGYKEDHGDKAVNKANPLPSGCYRGEKLSRACKQALYTGEYYVPGVIPAIWDKIFKRELLFSDYVPADPTIKMGDDAAVSYPMLAKAQCIVVDDEFTPYHYRVVEGSQSRAYDDKYFDRAVKLLEGLSVNLSANEDMKRGLPYYALFILNIGISMLYSRNVKSSLFQKMNTVRNAMNWIKKYVSFEALAWEGFTERERKAFSLLIKGQIVMFTVNHYACVAADKLKK